MGKLNLYWCGRVSCIFITLPAGGVCLHRQDGHPHSEQHGVHRVLHRRLPVQVPGHELGIGRTLRHRWTCEQSAAESWQGECCGVPPSVVKVTHAATYGHYIARCSERPFIGHPHMVSFTCQHKHSTWRGSKVAVCSWHERLIILYRPLHFNTHTDKISKLDK